MPALITVTVGGALEEALVEVRHRIRNNVQIF